jgi:outer membrane lipoprotein-sorting protein
MDVIKMNKENIEEILKEIGNENVPADVQKIAEETARDFSEKQAKQPRHYVLWEYIMRSRITKLAAAVVIIIAVLISIRQFGSIESVALADVLQKIEQAQAFVYKMKMNMTGNMQPGMPAGEQQIEATVTVSTEYGMKMDMDMDMNTVVNGVVHKMRQLMYILPEEKKIYMIMPEQKQYIQMEFDESMFARMKKQSNDPREVLRQIVNSKYTDIGESVIDGVEVIGFETTDPAIVGGMMEDVKITFWVDRKTELPVLEEMYYKVNEQMEMEGELYDFQWDAQVNADEFKPVIPEDYTTVLPGGYKIPSASEEGAIEGLRFCEQLLGRYPKKIDMMSVMNEIAAIKDSNTPAALRLREELKADMNNLPDEEKAKKIMEIMRPVQSLGIFYMMLVQDGKEPIYYGESVGPDDADAVLMRWKIPENRYRVIFGDLTAEDVTAEQLEELEKPSVKQ